MCVVFWGEGAASEAGVLCGSCHAAGHHPQVQILQVRLQRPDQDVVWRVSWKSENTEKPAEFGVLISHLLKSISQPLNLIDTFVTMGISLVFFLLLWWPLTCVLTCATRWRSSWMTPTQLWPSQSWWGSWWTLRSWTGTRSVSSCDVSVETLQDDLHSSEAVSVS